MPSREARTPEPRRCTGSTLPARARRAQRRGARVTRGINGRAPERELGRLSDGSGLGPTAVAERRTVARSPATSVSTHVEAELIRLACADTNSLARRWRVLFGRRAPDLPRALLQRI